MVHDTTTDERMETAVALFLRLRAELPGTAESVLAERAIDATYCTNVALGSDAVACRLDSIRGPLMAELMRRART